ncbi:MAG: type II toxin-antitoxin system RelE/ParE family toxin [Bacteroidia bacterium]
MKSGYKIIWTDEAKFNLLQIITYLENTWTEKEIKKFYTKLEETISLISSNPKLFRLTDKRKNVRKCVLFSTLQKRNRLKEV